MKIAWTKRTKADWTTVREDEELRHYEIPEEMKVEEGDYVLATRAHGELTMMKVIKIGDESELVDGINYLCPLIGVVDAKAHQKVVNQRIALKEANRRLEEATKQAEEHAKKVQEYLNKLELSTYGCDITEFVANVAKAGDAAAKDALIAYKTKKAAEKE